ncbi:exported hypothetical protein [Xanthomonas citri pv. fuscans]|nr:exported hypothetical protein [Xanthomonas citri pv. fuscans]SOO00777.1 exported hypothetical protein [Xanthomonas citri pv. fuscans]SOO06433.1 exported hypothetical protein [Xanthomonas citri pv. fuscans]SOO11004.1 exported hypothetical protein [Xanthomonas citri pv. fuscans]SOO15482.1 exported hypothetical protein [Xanthomonas citri pv. fuscans]
MAVWLSSRLGALLLRRSAALALQTARGGLRKTPTAQLPASRARCVTRLDAAVRRFRSAHLTPMPWTLAQQRIGRPMPGKRRMTTALQRPS